MAVLPPESLAALRRKAVTSRGTSILGAPPRVRAILQGGGRGSRRRDDGEDGYRAEREALVAHIGVVDTRVMEVVAGRWLAARWRPDQNSLATRRPPGEYRFANGER